MRPVDPLSDILSVLKPVSYKSGGFDVPSALSIRFPKYDGIKCYAVISGQCWLSVDGVPDAVLLKAGDCFLLPHGKSFSLATDLSHPPMDWETYLVKVRKGIPAPSKDGDSCYMVGGYFTLDGGHAAMLLNSLAPIVHIRNDSDRTAMRWTLERMNQEVRNSQPGSRLIAQQLAYTMLVQALRLHLTEGARGGVGWLYALADKQMNLALSSMHDDPAHRWTLQELAESVGMSRAFTTKFRETVGETPMEYLTRWRMLLAGDRLKKSNESISIIATSFGYESESAFGKAFKRVIGSSPRQYSFGSRPIAASAKSTQD
jgi:AraC-like DNA-binding protein